MKNTIWLVILLAVIGFTTTVSVLAQSTPGAESAPPEIPGMVWIPAGTFTMGSPASEARRDAGETQHQVTLTKGFYMGKHLVTQAKYEEVMGGQKPSYYKTAVSPETSTAKRPVETVSWFDAVEFCNRLSRMEGLRPVYSINGTTVTANWNASGYRLPTEAQWEYACRAGTTTAYNTGDTISNDTGWYTSRTNRRTRSVGEKPANAWGLFDMHGNVWEWCWDWHEAYASGTQTDPTGAADGDKRVMRGGSWYDDPPLLRSAYRGSNSPSIKYDSLGFRLVRPAQ